MARTPADEHTAEFDQLAGLSALGVLEGEERTRFERHRSTCARCQLMVQHDREALNTLVLTAPEMDPSPDFKVRLMQRAAAELAQTAPAAESTSATTSESGAPLSPSAAPRKSVVRLPSSGRNISPFRRRSSVLSALAAVLVVGVLTLGVVQYENQPVTEVALHGDAPGAATVIVHRSGSADLQMTDVPDPGPGHVYEAWIIAQGQQPVAAGVITDGNARVPLQGDVRGKTVAITRETGLVSAPTSNPLMLGDVRT